MNQADRAILNRFGDALRDVYGSRLERVVLFGSRARNSNPADSDFDVAVFLNVFEGFGVEAGRLAGVETDILLDTGDVINALPFEAGAYDQRTGFMAEVRREGVNL